MVGGSFDKILQITLRIALIQSTSDQFNLCVIDLGKDEDGEPITSRVVVPDASVFEARRVKLPQGGNQKNNSGMR